MRNESGDINADETAAVDPKIEDAEPEDQPMGGAAAEAAANSFEEKSQEPAGALDANASEELDCYDPEDPSTNIAGEQVFTEQLDDEFAEHADQAAEVPAECQDERPRSDVVKHRSPAEAHGAEMRFTSPAGIDVGVVTPAGEKAG